MDILNERITFKDGTEKPLRQAITDINKAVFNDKIVTDTTDVENEYQVVYVKDEATYVRKGEDFTLQSLTAAGERGPAGTITIGNVTHGITPEVVNVGTPEEAILDFKLPRGNDGLPATIAIGSVTSGDVCNVVNSGTPTNAVLDFTLVKGVKGDKGEDAIAALNPKGQWTVGVEYHVNDYVTAPDTNTYTCTNDHIASDDNEPPNETYWQVIALRGARGPTGNSATIAVGNVTSGETPSVTNVGTPNDAVFEFVLPKGDQGDRSTIQIGNVETGDHSDVVNVGDEHDAIFDFTLEKGDEGLSAYEVAVKNGFIGTEEEWLESLHQTFPLSVRRLGKYLYEVTYDHLLPHEETDTDITGGCSSYVKNGKLYRNFDYNFDDGNEYLVRFGDITGMSPATKLSQLPYHLVDGCNENGIMAAVHLVFNEDGWVGTGDEPCYMGVYNILTQISELTQGNIEAALVTLKNIPALADNDYAPMFFVTDGTTTYVAEPHADGFHVKDITANAKLTNFFWQETDPVSWADVLYGDKPTGVERFRSMPCDMADIAFTNAYKTQDYLSEFIGIDGTTKASTEDELKTIQETAAQRYIDQPRNNGLWQTVHSVVYDKSAGMVALYCQENFSKNYVGVTPEEVTEALILDPNGGLTRNVGGLAVKPVAYSTNEVKTNETWIDGKPVYRRVVDLGDVTIPGLEGQYIIPTGKFNLSGMASVIDGRIICVTARDYVRRVVPIVLADYNNTDTARIMSYVLLGSGYNKVLVVEYTKTTD